MATIFGNDLQRVRIRNDADLSSIICGLLRTIYVRVDSTPKKKNVILNILVDFVLFSVQSKI